MKAAAHQVVHVFADIGPIQEQRNVSQFAQYRTLVDIFLAEGATCFLFETLSNTSGICEIARYIKQRNANSCVIVSFAVTADGYSRQGIPLRQLLQVCEEETSIDACGMNCICGPMHMKRMVQRLPVWKKPLLIMPNAGYPTIAGNKTYFRDSSDYFAQEMLDIYRKGACILGGCCGTTPSYIEKLNHLLQQQQPSKRPATPQDISCDKMVKQEDNAIKEKLNQKKCIIAVEFDPPANGDIEQFLRHAQYLKEAGVDALTIADCPIARARMDASLLACKLHRELDMDVIPHMTCRDRNINATKALLFGLHMEGIRNVLVVTGDPIPAEDRHEVKGVLNFNSRLLANYIRDLNETMFSRPFQIFGALNLNAVNFAAELQRAREKQKSGMHGFLTQPIHSKRALANLKQAREVLDGYILGGVLPVVSHRNALYMNNEIAGIEVDEEIVSLYANTTREEAQQLAVKLSCATIDEMAPYVDGYYLITPFHRVEIIGDIIAYVHAMEHTAG